MYQGWRRNDPDGETTQTAKRPRRRNDPPAKITSPLQHPITPPLWAQLRLRLQQLNRLSLKNNSAIEKLQKNMAAAILRLDEDTRAFQPCALPATKISKLSTYNKKQSSYNILNALQEEVYYLHELWYGISPYRSRRESLEYTRLIALCSDILISYLKIDNRYR